MKINNFLWQQLGLRTHKISVQSVYAGVDILGEVFFAHYKNLRKSTERRMKRRENESLLGRGVSSSHITKI